MHLEAEHGGTAEASLFRNRLECDVAGRSPELSYTTKLIHSTTAWLTPDPALIQCSSVADGKSMN